MSQFLLIDVEKLSKDMAAHRFQQEFESKHPWSELYEQVDESGDWYLKPAYASILEDLEANFHDFLLKYEITNIARMNPITPQNDNDDTRQEENRTEP